MANMSKKISPKTFELMKEINCQMEKYIAIHKHLKPDGKYTKRMFCHDVGVSSATASVMAHDSKERCITLDTAVRLLHGCGMTIKIVPELMPKEMYMHKDIIMPSIYNDENENNGVQ